MTQRIKTLALIIVDLVILYGSLLVTVVLYTGGYSEAFFLRHLLPFSILFPLWLVVYFIEGLYSLRTFDPEGLAISCVRGQIINTVIGFIFFYLFSFTDITPRANLLILAFLSLILIFFWRKLFYNLFSSEGLKLKTVMFAKDKEIDEIENHLKNKPYLGFHISKRASLEDPGLPKKTDLIIIDRALYRDQKFLDEVLLRMNQGISFMEMSKFSELITGKIPVSSIDETWFIENCGDQSDKVYWLMKNLLDRGVALTLFIFFFPIFMLLIPFLLLTSGRPIFYSQIRTGHRNKPFRIYKLRTMRTDAEKSGAKWATPGDNRVTRIGKFLRMSRLDEIPQLWNIINGDMSLVGPRPERPEMIEGKLDKNIPFYNFRHLVKPGVTGWAQVNYGYGYSEDDALTKLQYDLYYVKNKSIWIDIKIILKTIKTVLTGMGH